MLSNVRSLSLAFALAACGAGAHADMPASPLSNGPAGIDRAGMDTQAKPGNDFFAYANGNWLKSHDIPPDRSSFGTGALVQELTAKRTSELIIDAAKSAPAGSEAQKVGDYYASFLDTAAIDGKGLAPIQPALDRIAKIGDAHQLASALGATLRADVDILNNTNFDTENVFGVWIAQDLDDPSKYAPFVLQGGLGLPDRDYYLDESAKMAEIRDHYRAYIRQVLELAHVADAEAKAGRIFELEVQIAKAHGSRTDTQDVQKGNNHWKRAELEQRAPGVDWQALLAAAGLDKQAVFVIWQPSAVIGISALVASQPLAVWKDYLAFHAISHAASVLPHEFDDASFAFYGTQLSGAPQKRERWKRAVDATSDALGESVGKLYVARYFPPSAKARITEMVKNELAAFALRIDKLTWMAPATKEKAKAKLAALKVGVGYPDTWRDYAKLEVVRGDAYGNFERAQLFEYQRNLGKLGKPVDRSEWCMNPQLVNAVNLPAMNALNFPAAILQPPYFDPARPIAMDYGATGSVIGHEISHSFDDTGALFDASGRLANWWTPEDFAHFKASSEQLVKQYDGYKPFPDLAVNGKLTVSENIADVAGLAASFDAYRIAFGGKQGPTVDGLTGDQQFFVSFAQSWRQKAREAAERRQVLTNGHAPAEFRALTVRNLDAWYDAFGVAPGDALYLAPADRVRVW
ncbi:MAG TPA: M13 family metallopeptidase [Kofleriaceae bacterium]|nr:M13 family metallopeptidase [Kofleriaceae bacterium]